MIYRSEQYEVTWGTEKIRADDPRNAALTATYLTNVFGIMSSANLPDPIFDWQPTYAFATNTFRTWYKMYKGKVEYRGSIPDIWLLDGRCLRLPIGTCATKGTTSGTKGSTTLDVAAAAGDTAISLTSSSNFSDNDYVRIGNEGAWNVEYRQISGAPNPFAVVALTYAHNSGEAVVEVNTILSSAAAAGDVSVAVSDPAVFTSGTYICIGAGSRNAEMRLVTSNGVSPVTFAAPLAYAHSSTEIETGADLQTIIDSGDDDYWSHTIYDSFDLSPITLAVTNIKDDLSVGLERRYYGGKVGSATISASEGEELRMSLDDIFFRDLDFESPDKNGTDTDIDFPTNNPNKYASLTRPTFTLPTTERYLFSQGSISVFGIEFARIKRAQIRVSNSLIPQYYVSDNTLNQIPYEFRESKKEYSIALTADIADDRFYTTLLNQGVPLNTAFADSARTGFAVSLTFTRGTNDSIIFNFPSNTPAASAGNEGCFLRNAPHNIMADNATIISVDLDIIARNCEIAVRDKTNYVFP